MNYQNNNDPYGAQYDQENQQYNQMNNMEDKGGLYANSRLGFIRKVYLILSSQLLLTVILCAISMGSPSFLQFQVKNVWLFYFAMVMYLVSSICIFCYHKLAVTVPINYILLLTCTLGLSWMVGMICGLTGQTEGGSQLVFIAAAMTLGIVAGLTIYALTTKTDFTTQGGFLCVLSFTFMFMGLFMWIFNGHGVQWLHIVYCSLGVLLFGFYLVYDTQLVAGGEHNRFKLDHDQYIIGALILYIDIIQIFLYILDILLSLSKK